MWAFRSFYFNLFRISVFHTITWSHPSYKSFHKLQTHTWTTIRAPQIRVVKVVFFYTFQDLIRDQGLPRSDGGNFQNQVLLFSYLLHTWLSVSVCLSVSEFRVESDLCIWSSVHHGNFRKNAKFFCRKYFLLIFLMTVSVFDHMSCAKKETRQIDTGEAWRHRWSLQHFILLIHNLGTTQTDE